MTTIRGLSYPLEVSGGSLKLTEDNRIVEQQIISVIETRPFERVMRADYGLSDGTFDTIEPAAIDAKISEAITEQVSGISDISVKGSWTNSENGVYNVEILYTVSGEPQPPLELSLVI
jgi:hypothetical protein